MLHNVVRSTILPIEDLVPTERDLEVVMSESVLITSVTLIPAETLMR